MKILRFTFFAAVLFAFAASANAQQCSQVDQPTKTWNQQPPDPLCPNPGYSTDVGYTVYSTTVDSCYNTNTGTTYAQSVRQVTGKGIWNCSNFTSLNLKCDPTITQQVTTATSSTDYNRFYLRAWDAVPDLQFASNPCIDPQNYPMARQDFWQCIGVACTINRCTCRDCGCGSPIIIDLNGKGFALTDWEQGVKFDIFGDGNPVQMGWTAPGADNAFLALPGADGLVHSSRQLFGNFTPQPQSATPNGFAALAVYDDPKNGGNGDGVIDARDAVFASLRLWIDANHDGISQPEELHTLPSLGVNSIGLKYKEDDRTDKWGNVLRYHAQVNPGDATSTGRMAYDVFFVAELPATTKNMLNPTGGKCQVPDKKVGMMAVKPAALR
jgi:hypothetical protein